MQKTILITGGSSGFGKATAKLFQSKGWNVVATMRSPQAEKELTALANVRVVKLDVQDDESINQAVSDALDSFGRIDVLVNSAGYGSIGPFEAATDTQIKRQFGVNLFGLMAVTRQIIPVMRRQNSGVIVNLSSFGGITAMPLSTLYNSSKFAVEGFSESLYYELSQFNIGVKLIEPGGVATNFRNGLELIQSDQESYQLLLSRLFANYPGLTDGLTKATAEGVAAVIFEAATGNSSQLRYPVGADAAYFIDLKIQNDEATLLEKMGAVIR